MKFNKLALVTAVSAAVGGVSGIANAQITGLPGEALLVPMVLSGAKDGAPIETYIGLYVPETIGQDTVINRYTAPHVAPAGALPVTQNLPEGTEIYWALFDENSKKVQDGYCPVSTGDKTVWTTDYHYREVQLQQRRGILQAGITDIPDPVCGPSLPISNRFGYVTFQTVPGADGWDADFAFWGNAWILDQNVIGQPNSIASVPVMPMADGYDVSENEEPWIGNQVIASGTLHQDPPVADSPNQVAPIAAGIRMNNADGDEDEDVVLQAEIRGPATGSEMSLHVFWFDKNNAARVADTDIWDDQEGTCSDTWPLPRELNLVLYNYSINNSGFPATGGWGVLNSTKGRRNVDGSVTDVIDAVQPPIVGGYVSHDYCIPTYWQDLPSQYETAYPGALNGYVQYAIQEEGLGTDVGGVTYVNEAAVAFNWQESLSTAPTVPQVGSGWSSHMTTDLGKQ